MSLKRCQNGHLFSEKRHGGICPYCSLSVSSNSGSSEDPQGMYVNRDLLDMEPMKPVTGWLVCINGPSEGKDYRIVPEKNFIGRAKDMDLRILNDDSVDERNHAIIIYDPQKNKTTIQSGSSHGLAYVFDDEDKWEAINESKEIAAGTKIKIGKSEFLFVPLCSDDGGNFYFRWEEK